MRDTDLSGFGPVGTNADTTDCRAEFERWARKRGYKLSRFAASDDYAHSYTHITWEAWQACWLHLKGEGDV